LKIDENKTKTRDKKVIRQAIIKENCGKKQETKKLEIFQLLI
jgi:hypothetical protein